jgi:hypothetical protein
MDGRLWLPATAPCRWGVTFRIAIPAAMSAAAAPIVIVVIVARPRAGEPALVVPRRHRAAAIIIIVAIACARTAALFPAAPRWLGVALGIAVPTAMRKPYRWLPTNASSKVGRPRPDGDHPNMRHTRPQRLQPIARRLCKNLG